MSLLRSLSDGLRSLFRKERVEHELDEELNGFLEMAAVEKMKQGMSRGNRLSRRAGKICGLRLACCGNLRDSRSLPFSLLRSGSGRTLWFSAL